MSHFIDTLHPTQQAGRPNGYFCLQAVERNFLVLYALQLPQIFFISRRNRILDGMVT